MFTFTDLSRYSREDDFIISQENICLCEDVLKMCWRGLEDVFGIIFFVSEDTFRTPSKCVCKKSTWRRIEDFLKKTSWRRLCKVLKNLWRHLKDIFGRRPEDLEDEKVLYWRGLQDIFKTSWKIRIICWNSFKVFYPK